MKATLEEHKVIKIVVDKWFYEGKTGDFTLYCGHEKKVLEVERTEETDEAFIYFSTPQPDIDITKVYTLYEKHAKKCLLAMGSYIRSTEFDDAFYYDGDDLGPTYQPEATTFKLWAPVAHTVLLKCATTGEVYSMTRGEKGIWSFTLDGDCDTFEYTYLVQNADQISEATDPYALTATANSQRSIVVDPMKFDFVIDKSTLSPAKGLHELVTYEASVRDYTFQQGKSTFKAMEEHFDYIEELGITNLQLLPVYDFQTVNETDKFAYYNWGYDPYNYNILDGSLVDDPDHPYERCNTFGQLIAHANSKGIRVSMDVVYNHLYDADGSIYNRIVPGYYIRFHKDGSYSNGSFCGNDFRSEGRMVRKFIVDSVLRFVRVYGVAGFRFDLMGDLDIDTMNAVKAAVGPDILIYGEGWNMPSALEECDRACIENQHALPDIAHFNDRFRNAFRGTSGQDHERGLIYGSNTAEQHILDLLSGSPHVFSDLSKSLNYIECHDNHTFYDWLKYVQKMTDEDEIKAVCTAGIATVLLSFSAPFIHAGQEFLRTKKGVENSYNVSDEFNQFDWSRIDLHRDIVDFTQQLISYRQSKAEYGYSSEELKKHVTFSELRTNVVEIKSDNLHILMNFTPGDVPNDIVTPDFSSNLPVTPGKLLKHQICFS